MKKPRIKIKLPTVASRDEAEALVGEIQLITANQLRTSATMDAQLAHVRERYEGNLAAYAEALKTKTDALRAWAEANPDEFPKGRKSIQFVHGTIGFRTGTPKLALLNRVWNWDKVHKMLITLGLAKDYVRTKEEVDKEAIIAAASKNPDPEGARLACAVFGTKVVQDESFFVEPLITDVAIRQITESALS
jgi:phage host-nuclease inhibitor protein Gam